MRKQKLLFLLLTFFLPLVTMSAAEVGDTVTSLVISEWRGDTEGQAYLELTNMGDEAVDLSKFTVWEMTPWTAAPGLGVNYGDFANYLRLWSIK